MSFKNSLVTARLSSFVEGGGMRPRLTQHFSFAEPDSSKLSVFWGWVLLFYAAVNRAAVPPINMSVKYNKFLKISWRFFNQGLTMLPFTLYEYRKSNYR
jgi:hypothetical protein